MEFAFVAPFLIGTALGIVELTRAYDAQNLIETAAREGARFASMDREGMLARGSIDQLEADPGREKLLGLIGARPRGH